jgi:hypothetical protein
MNLKYIKNVVIVLVLLSFIPACTMPSPTEPPTVVPTIQATEVPNTPLPTDLAIQHTLQPINLPTKRNNQAMDYDSSQNASKKITTGDRFTFGRFERPFSTNMDAYFPQLDIVNTFVFQDETWIYGKITVKGHDSSNSLTGKYALELDLDRNGKGDWLVSAINPASTEWSVNGVQIYQDANKDVGNVTPMFTDEKATGDGFESLVFDQGTGSDPDSAWVRISPDDPNTVEISVKRSVLGNPTKYLINMWSGSSMLNPSLFDINDHFTHEQAGAADPGFELYYPIKAVFEIDNSCRMSVGFQPTGLEPGLCQVRTEKAAPQAPGSPQLPPPPKCGCSCIPC